MSNDDVTLVTKTRVACDGGGGALGHPKTYLDMGCLLYTSPSPRD